VGITVIADELTAVLFRLAGAKVLVPDPREVGAAFAQARADTGLLLITAGLANRLPEAVLEQALRQMQPLTQVIPDALGRERPVDVVKRTRRILGVEA